jgi:hypothetical protein
MKGIRGEGMQEGALGVAIDDDVDGHCNANDDANVL